MLFLYNDPDLKSLRRILRRNQTEAERILWSELRDRRLLGYKFFRQYGVGRYILDFYCTAARLAIELDGSHHGEYEQRLKDRERTYFLQECNIRVIRFWNYEVYQNITSVIDAIIEQLDPSQDPL
jgi:very-short-patch-repair endonuclease